MGLIQRPIKHLGTRTYQTEVAINPNDPILDNEVDGDLDTIYGEFNGRITDANIDPAAGIQGSKLADNSVTAAKLVNPPSVNFKTVPIPDNLAINQASGETVIFTLPAITSVGGLIVLGQSALGFFSVGAGSGSAPAFRIYRDGTLVHIVRSAQVNNGAAGFQQPAPPIAFVESPGAGAHVYEMRIEIFNAGVTYETTTLGPNLAGIAFVYELP